MMMNSRSVPHALIERVPLSAYLWDDTDAVEAESFGKCICRDAAIHPAVYKL